MGMGFNVGVGMGSIMGVGMGSIMGKRSNLSNLKYHYVCMPFKIIPGKGAGKWRKESIVDKSLLCPWEFCTFKHSMDILAGQYVHVPDVPLGP